MSLRAVPNTEHRTADQLLRQRAHFYESAATKEPNEMLQLMWSTLAVCLREVAIALKEERESA